MITLLGLRISLMIVFSIFYSFCANSPLKLCLMLLRLSTISTTLLYFSTSSSWFPITLFLLFTGGILVIIRVFCSIEPNTSEPPIKSSVAAVIAGVLVIMMLSHKSVQISDYQRKIFVNSPYYLALAFFIFLVYLVGINSSLSSTPTPIKTMSS